MIKIPKATVNYYCGFYPKLDCRKVEKVLKEIKQKFGYLDAITVQHHIMMRYGSKLLKVI